MPLGKTGWKKMKVNLAQLSNTKFDEPDTNGWVYVPDADSGEPYRVRVVGRPDLRRVKRFYFGVVNEDHVDPVSFTLYLNEVMLEGVKRERGLAERIALRLNMADVIRVDFDWSKRDAEFHGLNARVGQGFTQKDWHLTASTRLDDFVPLLGFRLPVNASQQRTIKRPKYLTNSDVELIDPADIEAQSNIDDRESYSARLSHSPSRAAIPRYLIDPWAFSISGSRSTSTGPLQRSRRNNLSGSANFDLRIAGKYLLGNYGFLGKVPLLKGISILPSKISFGGSFRNSESRSETVNLDGTVTPRPLTIARTGTFSGSLEYVPLSIATVSYNLRSERDFLRIRKLMGVNIGEENSFGQDLRLVFKPPKATGLPQSKAFKPVRLAVKALNEMRPSVTFNGTFTHDHSPSLWRQGDPENIRSVNNSGDWEYRLRLPLDSFFKSVLPEKKDRTEQERQQMLDRQRRLDRRSQARGRGRQPSGDRPSPDSGESPEISPELEPDEELTPEERRLREEEALLEAARERERQEEEEGLQRGEEPAPGETVDEEAGEEAAPAKRPRLRIPNPLDPLFSLLRNISPVQVSVTRRRQSSYSRVLAEIPLWYRLGLAPELDTPDSMFATSSLTDRLSYNFSTSLKVTRQISLDLKYRRSHSSRDQAGLATQSLQRDWPDARISLTGLERWRIFGGGGDKEGMFRSSNIDFSYKKSLAVNNYTEINYNPRTTKTFSPRWNMTFRNGMSASINVGVTNDLSENAGTETLSKRLNIGLQLRHSFRAERFLAKLKLYKPGSNPTLNMDIDIQYSTDTRQRTVPGADNPDAPTGHKRFSISPRFSYQITRNLTGAFRLAYNRGTTIESNLVAQSFALGMEVTFVF